MKGFTAALATALFTLVSGQTYTNCNPLHSSCPADPALGGTYTADFSKGPSDRFFPQGTTSRIGYGPDGVGLSVVGRGDSPLLMSDFYFMFGRVDVVLKAAPGQGIVTSVVMESDDLDEVDWEFLGGDQMQVQSNYFGKGDTSSYNRGAFHPLKQAAQAGYQTYSVVWTSAQISWIINGETIRTLTAEQGGYMFPQTPMRLKIGIWAGGDPSNNAGTIQWAGGETTYTDAGYTMFVKSATIQDYSTGKSYSYSDNTGSWGSIRSDGGSIYGNGAPPSGGTPTLPEPGSAITIASAANPLTPLQSTFMTVPKQTDPLHTGWPWVSTAAHATPKHRHTSTSSHSRASYTSLQAHKPVNAAISVTDAPTQTPEPTASSSYPPPSASASSSLSGSSSSATRNRVAENSIPIAITLIVSLLCIF